MPECSPLDRKLLVERIRAAILGDDVVLEGPFGPRRMVYADYTASGRSLRFLEEFLVEQVLPRYANTHTETSATGLQTTALREESRSLIHEAVGGGPEDLVVFCGSGATAAIAKVIDLLGLRIPAELDSRYGWSRSIPVQERPVVFIGPYEHHSNELPWRESIAEVVTIPEDADGQIDLEALKRQLEHYEKRPLKIGSFSAASNVTGLLSDTRAITRLLHEHGALAFWDYAAAGPYLPIDMSPSRFDPALVLFDKDAVFLSPHKFVGGPGTPGILVAKRTLFRNRVPTVPGGGTVAYVNPIEHDYLSDPVHREEGGTPAILESIRAGLVFWLKRQVGEEWIETREQQLVRGALERWSGHPKIRILGSLQAPRLAILSFLIRHGQGYLHHNFVVALLNDLFGIQARGGCSCAGPYGHRLLGIDLATSHRFEQAILAGCEGVKPGWTRVGFNYFFSDTVVDYILAAVERIADRGWQFLPHYRFEPASGQWRHRQRPPSVALRLRELTWDEERLETGTRLERASEEVLHSYLVAFDRLADAIAPAPPASGSQPLPEPFERLRWFPLPEEVGRGAEPHLYAYDRTAGS